MLIARGLQPCVGTCLCAADEDAQGRAGRAASQESLDILGYPGIVWDILGYPGISRRNRTKPPYAVGSGLETQGYRKTHPFRKSGSISPYPTLLLTHSVPTLYHAR